MVKETLVERNLIVNDNKTEEIVITREKKNNDEKQRKKKKSGSPLGDYDAMRRRETTFN